MFYDIVPPIIGVKDLQSEHCCKLNVTTRLRKWALTQPVFAVTFAIFFPGQTTYPAAESNFPLGLISTVSDFFRANNIYVRK